MAQAKKVEKKSKKEILIGIAVIAIITILLVVVANNVTETTDFKEVVGKSICQNNSFIYLGIHQISLTKDEVRCGTNSSFPAEHYNLTAPQFIITAQVDWEYYKGGEQK